MGSFGYRDRYFRPAAQPDTDRRTEWQRLAERHESPGCDRTDQLPEDGSGVVQHDVVCVPSTGRIRRCGTQLTAWPRPPELEPLAVQELRAQRNAREPFGASARDVQYLEPHRVQRSQHRVQLEQLWPGYVGV